MKKQTIQILNLALAFFLFLIMLAAMLGKPHMGLSLTLTHRMVLVLTTLLLVWAGLGDNTKRVYRIDLGLAIFFIGSFFVGLLLSLPIVIHNGRLGTEEVFGTFSPRILDLGPKDFYFHGVLGTLLLFFTVYWFARYYKRGES